ncbi:MAG: bacillithiol biosynthesis cysteine-adding enzyme BshC [Ignavibacteriales bacterium]|nr:bacillithiol biosynthesis cysteine-adding enzyme BshC [Ignavibacteriales bacterium]
MNAIDFRELPTGSNTFSSLFLDYVNDYAKLQEFYNGNFQSDNDWKSVIQKVVERPLDRSSIVQILTNQNRNFHCGVRTLAHIDSLLNDNTVAVVTGQQVGLFTGPLYTIYKTLTTLKLVEKLAKRFPEYNFVPIFWLEGEDHDYEEVSSINLINTGNDVAKFEYQLGGNKPDKNLGAVGTLEFDETIDTLFQNIDQALVQTEFKPKVLELFKTAYQKGMTFNRAFVHLMNVLLEDSGLVFLDPHDIEVKKLLAPLFKRELAETPKFCQLVIDQSAELEKRYHAQIKPKSLNLFLFHHGGRFLLEPKPDGYGLKGTRQHLTKEQVQEFINNSPELFSPNVVLRPLCQDWLLPTVAYVAGPSEIAYFGQLKSLYQEVQIPFPIIYPRSSITIIEEKVEKVLNRYSLPLTEFFNDAEMIKEKVAAQISDVNVEELFGGTLASLRETLDAMQPAFQNIDPTLLGALDNANKKIISSIESLKEKTIAAQKRQHEVALRQIDKTANHVFPLANFQERELNVLYFLNKYGLEFLRWLYGELSVDTFKHQVINL